MSDAVEMLAGLRDSLSAFAPTGIVMDPDGLEVMICTIDLAIEQVEYERRPNQNQEPAREMRVKPASLGDIVRRIETETAPRSLSAKILTFPSPRTSMEKALRAGLLQLAKEALAEGETGRIVGPIDGDRA
jgi:hypothetical protein